MPRWRVDAVVSPGIVGRQDRLAQSDVAVSILPGGFAVTVGERGGAVHVSHDYGRTWTARTSTGGALHDVVFLTEQLGWAVGDALRIEHTSDGGQSWTTQQHIPSRHVLATIDMLDAHHGFAAGTGGSLSTTDGATWRPVPVDLPHQGATNALRCDFVTPRDGFLCGRIGFIATTADGGQTWTDRSLPGFDDDTTAIRAVTAAEAYLGVTDRINLSSRLLHTTDSGRTWQVVWSGDDSITHIERSAAGELWLCGTRGMIVRRDPDGAWVAFGVGCGGGSGGAPALTATAPPRLAQTLQLRATGLSAQATVAALMAGASTTTWAGVPLPLDLGLLGMGGCLLYVAPDVVIGTAATAGAADWALRVPDDPSLLGEALHAQALAPDPSANPAGIALANAGTAWVGR